MRYLHRKRTWRGSDKQAETSLDWMFTWNEIHGLLEWVKRTCFLEIIPIWSHGNKSLVAAMDHSLDGFLPDISNRGLMKH